MPHVEPIVIGLIVFFIGAAGGAMFMKRRKESRIASDIDQTRSLAESSVIFPSLLVMALLVGYALGSSRSNILDGHVPTPPSKPIEINLNVSGLPASVNVGSVPAGRSGGLLGNLTRAVADAMNFALTKTTDAAKLPQIAAEEFTRGLSHEGGAAVVKLFEKLFEGDSSGAKTDADRVTVFILHDLVKDNPVSPCCRAGDSRTDKPKTVESVLFEINRAAISPSGYAALNRVRAFAAAHRDAVILLSGSADTTGSVARNRTLARQRTQATRTALTRDGGIAPERVLSVELTTNILPVLTASGIAEPLNRVVAIEIRE